MSLFRKLASNRSGNTLMIVAASLVPLMGLIGGGLDVSRSYMAKSRLQLACDAAVLAGRRTMQGTSWTKEAEDAANSFFKTNFPDGRYGTTKSAITYTVGTDLIVAGHASVEVPTSLMKVFGEDSMSVSVDCNADLQLPNTDVMFVLDTTGSMADTNPGDSVPRITALRSSVQSFYDTLEKAKASGTQVRYGFVPYATTVNVGFLLQRNWMADSWTYQSRVPDGTELVKTTTTTTTTTTNSAWTTLSGSSANFVTILSLEACVAAKSTSKNSDATTTVTQTQPDGSVWTIVTRTRTTTGSSYSVAISGGGCKQTETRYNNLVLRRTETTKPGGGTTTTTSTRYWWMYRPVVINVSGLKGTKPDGTMAGGNIVAQVANNHGNRTVTWTGCIEERDTVRTTNYAPIPTDAFDMDIDRIPSMADPRTQWRPALPGLIFVRNSLTNWTTANVRSSSNFTNIADHFSGIYASCPTASRKLSAISKTDIAAYLTSLKVSGNTYHDIGFVWGARLLSSTGLFASENSTAPNGGSMSRHLIFMTDGDTDTEIANYEAYGISALDRRRTSTASVPTDSAQNSLVESRLTALCSATKGKGITVWVIAFGTKLTSLLQGCASPDRAYQANNATELNKTFAEIAAQISQLRLVK